MCTLPYTSILIDLNIGKQLWDELISVHVFEFNEVYSFHKTLKNYK